MENAIILTGGLYKNSDAKTAHGLIRGTSRYNVVAVIDNVSHGKDAGFLLDKKDRNIPIFSSVKEFLGDPGLSAECAIIGVAVPGGYMPSGLFNDIKESIMAGMNIISGLHEFLSGIPVLSELAQKYDVELIDIRKPRPKKDLKFWSGEIFNVKSPIIAVLGTDCCVGKRTTSAMITGEMTSAGINAQMVFTGQTGWLQGYKYGFILDSTYNDFVSGELENAVARCYKETNPDIIILEGQSSLYNVSGPCGAEFLLSAQAKGVILQHDPAKKYHEGQESLGITISLKKEIEIIRLYGSDILAITLNTRGLSYEEAMEYKSEYIKKYDLPVIVPLYEGVGALTGIIKNYMDNYLVDDNSIKELTK